MASDGFSARILIGSMILIIGLGLLLNNMFSWFSFNYVWPLLIVDLGLYLIMRKK